jgi:glycosyltransferase involved in cell wall biosynthesis
MTEPRRILFVLEHYFPYIGGAETLFCSLAEALVVKGCQVEVVTTRHQRSLPKLEMINGVQVRRIDCRNRYFFTFLSLPAIIRAARNCDLVHTTTYNAALPAWLGARLARKPVVVTFHEVWGKLWFRLPFASLLARSFFFLYEWMLTRLTFDRVVAVSDFTRQALINSGFAETKVSRIHNGLLYEEFAKWIHQPPDHPKFLYFGRLGISKGLDLLIPAAATLFQKHPEAEVVLVLPRNPAPMLKKVQQLIEKHGVGERVTLLHELSREELLRQICSSSAVVIPSYSEGFCFVAAETVALEVPIVSSGKGALKEVVCGKYVECPELDEEHLAAALIRAAAGKWEERPIRYFPLYVAVQEYLAMYALL